MHVHFKDGCIFTDVFSKPTDGHLYLRTDSAHPKSCKFSIPYNVALRLKRICSRPELLSKRLLEFKEYLIKRGYSADFVQTQFEKVGKIDRAQLLQNSQKNKDSPRKYPLILDFNPSLPNIGFILRKNLHLLQNSPTLKELFSDGSIFPAFRNCKSSKENLKFPKRLNKDEGLNVNIGCHKCGRTRCDLCFNFLDESNHFTSLSTGRRYQIVDDLSCTSHNVIYLATCLKCKVQYVGSTATQFKVRFRNHKSDLIHNKGRCELAVHFNSNPHMINNIRFIIIEKIHSTNNVDIILTKREAYWMSQLCTVHPYGLNKRKEFNSHKRVSYLN